MPVEKVPYRLKPANIARASEATFQTSHEARIDRPLDDLDLNDFFNDVQANVQVGDQVTICAYEGGLIAPDRKLREIGVCRIIAKGIMTAGGKSTVRAAWIGETVKIAEALYAGAPKRDKIVKLDVKKEFGGGFTVRDEKGNVIESFKSKAEAEAYVAKMQAPAPETVEKGAKNVAA